MSDPGASVDDAPPCGTPTVDLDDDFGDFEAVPSNGHRSGLATVVDLTAGPDDAGDKPAGSSGPPHNSDSAPNVLKGDATVVEKDGKDPTGPDAVCACSKVSQGDSTSQDSGLCTCIRSSPTATNVPTSDGVQGAEDESGCGSIAVRRDDSFDDFRRAESGTVYDETSLPVWKEEEEEDDGFADFESAEAGGGFADFSAAFEEETEGKEEDGEWGAFAAGEERKEVREESGLEPCNPEELLRGAFPVVVAVGQSNPSEDVDIRLLESHEAHERLWEGLQDLDRAPSLRQQWTCSRACQHLLRSLNIDSRNILRNPAVPLFAMQLGLLEPQRGDSTAGGAASECPPSPPDCQESIPPAQFDWRSSGLVNPLEQPSSSSLLDLEFLSGLGSSTPHRTSSLEEEFLGDSPISTIVDSPKLPPRLQQLLESGTSTLDVSGRPPELSAEGSRLLDRLPDLSFMRATVLMFPVRL